jgi:ubiquinone/menaquinone biosynthesis C-methylase UbiE
MPDLAWNESLWDGNYNWIGRGEEWSRCWGGSEAQWFGCLYPRLHRFLPVGNLLEIAPGFGRWTNYLLRYVQGRYTGIDLSQECVDYCQQRFSRLSNTTFLKNDGLSLESLEDELFDFVFSFDSLVHANLDVHKAYIPQILRKLSKNGVAFIHHSNWAGSNVIAMKPWWRSMLAKPSTRVNKHNRAEDVSAAAYAKIVKQAGGHVMLQECVNWGSEEMIDTFTLFCRNERDELPETVSIENIDFMREASAICMAQSAYTKIN